MRLFISIPVPRCEAVDALLKDVAGIKGIRPSPVSQTHITLHILCMNIFIEIKQHLQQVDSHIDII